VLAHDVLVIGPLRDAMGAQFVAGFGGEHDIHRAQVAEFVQHAPQFVAGARFVHLSEIRHRALLRTTLRPTGLDEPPLRKAPAIFASERGSNSDSRI
jgi:hypothetical protein